MKRIIVLIALFWTATLYAQSSNFVGVTPNRPSSAFTCALTNIAATLTECQAKPAVATVSYYITDIIFQTTTATAGTFAIQAGTGTNCATAPAVGSAFIFPASGSGADRWTGPPTTAPTSVVQFSIPLKVPPGSAICMIGVATNTQNVQINGYAQ